MLLLINLHMGNQLLGQLASDRPRGSVHSAVHVRECSWHLSVYRVLSRGSPFAKDYGARAPAGAWTRDLNSGTGTARGCAPFQTACEKLVPFTVSSFLRFGFCRLLSGCMRSALDRPRLPQAPSSRIRSRSRPSSHFTVGIQHEVPRLLAET